MSNPLKCEPNDGIWKAMIFCSFIMLSALTWGAGPIQKVFEKVQHKETVKAKLGICIRIRQMLPVYEDWTRQLFTNGCLWNTRSMVIAIMPERAEEFRKQWKDQEGKEFDQANNACMEGAAAQQEENNMRDRVLSPIYHEELKCPDIYEEAKKLGLDEEEYVQ